MSLPDINKLCTPAQLYLFFTLLSLVMMIYDNSGMPENTLCMGNYRCEAPNKAILIFVKLVYIGFWTLVLNLMCKGGYKNLAWFLVLLPFILFIFILIFGFGPWVHSEELYIYEGMKTRSRKTASRGNRVASKCVGKNCKY